MDEKEMLELIEDNPFNIEQIKDPSEELQLKAVKENFFAIRCINNPTRKVQKEVVSNYPFAIKYIKKPCPSVVKMIDPKVHVVPKNITPNLEYSFYEPVYTTMEQIKYEFDCYINENVKFFQYKTLKGAMNYLFKQKEWRFENGSRACEIDIRRVDFKTLMISEEDIQMMEYFEEFKGKEYVHGLEVDMNFVLPLICGVEFCLDGHADYLVFEYERKMYLITILCYE